MSRPAPVFDEIVHPPNRLRILAFLATASTVEFSVVRDTLGVADSVTGAATVSAAEARLGALPWRSRRNQTPLPSPS